MSDVPNAPSWVDWIHEAEEVVQAWERGRVTLLETADASALTQLIARALYSASMRSGSPTD